MLSQVFVFLLPLGALLAASVPDFDHTSGHYEFIYHHTQNLLLTIRDQKCYHTRMNNLECKLAVENQVMLQIHLDEHIKGSSLNNLRNEFTDLLANFHCLDKQVFELELDSNFHCGTGNDDDDDK